MTNSRILRVPDKAYKQAKKLQADLRKQGEFLPLHECLVRVKRTKKKDDLDFFGRIGL